MSYEVNNSEIQALLREMGRSIKKQCPEGWGFVLNLVDFNSDQTFYLASIDRSTAAEFLREMAAKIERDS